MLLWNNNNNKKWHDVTRKQSINMRKKNQFSVLYLNLNRITSKWLFGFFFFGDWIRKWVLVRGVCQKLINKILLFRLLFRLKHILHSSHYDNVVYESAVAYDRNASSNWKSNGRKSVWKRKLIYFLWSFRACIPI